MTQLTFPVPKVRRGTSGEKARKHKKLMNTVWCFLVFFLDFSRQTSRAQGGPGLKSIDDGLIKSRAEDSP